MQSRVKILDDVVVNQIAAGEVVERPASVVKELVENAIDAGSSEITVVIAGGGKEHIEVSDNGSGMSREDALLAIERYGTSKVRNVEDLERIATLGFRGEALPSIASVSRFRLTTRRAEAAQASELTIEGGKLKGVQEIFAQPGTKVEVRSLFYNVPARKKFLRSENTETGSIKALIGDFALGRTDIQFRLIADGQEILNYRPTASVKDRIAQLALVQGTPIEISGETEHQQGMDPPILVAVQGAVCQPLYASSNNTRLRILVNGRVVRDRLLLKAAKEGYGAYLKGSQYPTGVILLTLNPEDVDVNVHPQKTEVRFRKPQVVFQAVCREIARGLSGVSPEAAHFSPREAYINSAAYAPEQSLDTLTPESAVTSPATAAAWNERSYPSESFAPASNVYMLRPRQENVVFLSNVPPRAVVEESARKYPQDSAGRGVLLTLRDMRYVGQVFELYLIFEGRDAMAMLDMHAAHERVMFYRLRSSFATKSVPSQRLLIPEFVPVPAELGDQIQSYITELSELGFELSLTDDSRIRVDAVPAMLGTTSVEALCRDIFSFEAWEMARGTLERNIDAVVARLACHSSVRSGQALNALEAHALVDQLVEAESSAFCPHGRPVVRFFSAYELESMFGRV